MNDRELTVILLGIALGFFIAAGIQFLGIPSWGQLLMGFCVLILAFAQGVALPNK